MIFDSSKDLSFSSIAEELTLDFESIDWDDLIESNFNRSKALLALSPKEERNLLHLAVLENRLDVVEVLSRNQSLRLQRDCFGLKPIDIAFLLGKDKVAQILEKNPCSQSIEVPQISGFSYISRSVFESEKGFEKVLSVLKELKDQDAIPTEKIWLGVYFERELEKALHPPVAIEYINEKLGWGVFAKTKIPACSFIGEYAGVIQEKSLKQLREKKYCVHYTLWESKKHFTIDAEHKGNFTRFINHSDQPNAALQSVFSRGVTRMVIIATKEIQKDEQITIDYGPEFWKQHQTAPDPI